MSDRLQPLSFFSEPKRRSVFKAGIAHLVVAWLVAQVQGSHTSSRIRTSYKAVANVR